MRVKVYWNLHKQLYSVVDTSTGRVVLHTSALCLTDAKFRVQPAGRRKVIETGTKNVHAYVTGTFQDFDRAPLDDTVSVTYNPFKYESFVQVDNPDVPVIQSSQVWLGTRLGGRGGFPWMRARV